MERVKKESLALKIYVCIIVFFIVIILPFMNVNAEDTDSDSANIYKMNAIINYAGSEITHTEDEIYYLNDAVDITLKTDEIEKGDLINEAGLSIDGENNEQSISYNRDVMCFVSYYDGEKFEDYVQIDGENLALTPGQTDEYNRKVVIFKKIESYKLYKSDDEKKKIIAVVERMYETPVYQFIFDNTASNISIYKGGEEVKKERNENTFDASGTESSVPSSADYKSSVKDTNNVVFKITDKCGIKSIVVNDNGIQVGNVSIPGDERIVEYEYTLYLGENVRTEGSNEVTVKITDLAGNETSLRMTYELDFTRPIIALSGIGDGNISSSDVSLSVDVSDNSSLVNLYFKCDYTNSDNETQCLENLTHQIELSNGDEENAKWRVGNFTRKYTKEGIYDITVFAYDLKGNYSDTLRISFAIDNSPPRVSLENVIAGHVYKEPVSVYATLREMFFMNTSVTMECTCKNSDVTEIIELSPYDIKSKVNKNIYTFITDGKYTIKMTAKDNFSRTTSSECKFTIDKTAPEIIINGNADVYNEPPEITVDVKDETSEFVIDTLLVRHDEGTLFEEIDKSRIVSLGKNVSYKVPVNSEGKYILKVSVTDDAGNSDVKSIEFIVDETPPVIDLLSDISGKYTKDFKLPNQIDQYIKDMTKIRYKTYLNSKEIASCEITKDGKYIIQIVAEDEAGNKSEERAAFIVDSTFPKIIVSGAGKDGNVNINDVVSLSLFDDMDYFESVSVNGKRCILNDLRNVTIPITQSGDYDITVSALDYAGNKTVETVKMKCAYAANPFDFEISSSDVKTLTKNEGEIRKTFLYNFSNTYFVGICVLAVILAVGFIVFAFVDFKKLKCDTRKDDNEPI